jgi:hypothetical protein
MENGDHAGLCISELPDAELLSNTRGLIGRSNQVFAALLAHLGEVEARGLYRARACSSLYAYCIYELRLSEDAAVRRVTAARLVRKFPILADAVATGELHLTGLLMLGPHLTRENHADVLARAKHRTKKEIAKLVRILDPLPEVPARIDALGPDRPIPSRATWAEYVASFSPVRELTPGDRPRDWADTAPVESSDSPELSAPARTIDSPEPSTPARATCSPGLSAPARVTVPLQYKVQFTATEEYVELVERAQALLARGLGEKPATLDEIQLEALRLFVARLEKKRGGARETGKDASKPETATPRPRSRRIPDRVRRAVFERDAGRCAYLDDTGRRCEETHRLELHHLEPFANGGAHTEANLTLRCQAHNALAAELDFGRARIIEKRDATRHLSQRRAREGALPPSADLFPSSAPKRTSSGTWNSASAFTDALAAARPSRPP